MKKILLVLGLAVILASSAQAAMRYSVEVGGMPYIGFQLNETQTIDVGLTYSSLNNGNTTSLTLAGRFENVIAQVDKVKLNWAGQLGITSATAAGATATTFNLIGLVGAEYKITDAVGLYGNINLLTFQSSNGTSSFTLLTGSTLSYAGLRVYI